MYNLSAYNLGNAKASCIFWNESDGDKGANEIASSLLRYVRSIVSKRKIKKIIMFSDACGGQNRNKYIATLCLYLLATIEDIESIEHVFMLTGHSHMEVDSIHSMIERYSRNVNIYIPSEWEVAACLACKDAYDVSSMDSDEIYDMKDVFNHLRISNVRYPDAEGGNSKKKGPPVYWKSSEGKEDSLIHWLKFSKGSDVMEVKCSYKLDDPFCKIDLGIEVKSSTRTRQSGASQYGLASLKQYGLKVSKPNGNPISKEKKEDLDKLCEKLVIPKRYHHFFSALRT